jgi:hypothetical protein
MEAQSLDQGVYLFAEEVGGPGRTEGGYATLSATCPVGQPCGARIRLIAILVDPVGHPPVDVDYTATAEARFPSSTGPVPSATIDVNVSDVQSRSAASVGMTTTRREEIHVGPDMPRAVRTVHLSLPEGPPEDPTLLPNALIVTRELGEGTSYGPDVTVRSLVDGQELTLPWAAATSPFANCVADAPCETDLELVFDWNGGPVEGSSIEWSLAVWPGVGADEPRPAATIDTPAPDDVSWDGPTLTSSTSGQASVARNGSAFINLNAALDLTDVPQGVGDVEGLVRLTFRAMLAPGADPAAKVRLSIEGNDIELPSPGETLTAYSRASDIICGGRSICQANVGFSVALHPGSADVPEATVDWTADVEFLPFGSGEVPDGAQLDLVVPSAPP